MKKTHRVVILSAHATISVAGHYLGGDVELLRFESRAGCVRHYVLTKCYNFNGEVSYLETSEAFSVKEGYSVRTTEPEMEFLEKAVAACKYIKVDMVSSMLDAIASGKRLPDAARSGRMVAALQENWDSAGMSEQWRNGARAGLCEQGDDIVDGFGEDIWHGEDDDRADSPAAQGHDQ